MVAGLLYTLRALERWLHQHIFKVGWLVTKEYQSTTILYYAFFLPGIFLHELVYWMVAGFLNVRADRVLGWPEKQEIGELKLNFIKLPKNVDPLRLAIISTAPLVVALVIVATIAKNQLRVQDFLGNLGSGFLDEVTSAINQFTSAPDFWIWVYLAFTISNTMFPNIGNLRGWRVIIVIMAIIGAVLFVIGAGSRVMITVMTPLADILNSLAGTLAVIIGIDLLMVAILGTIEAIIERITGNTATFKDGKMITMRREELLKQRAEAFAAARGKKLAPAPALPSGGPPSIYKLILPIPGAPSKEGVTRAGENILISPPPTPVITSATPVTRVEPSVIPGTTSGRANVAAPESRPAVSSPAPKPSLPSTTTPSNRQETDQEDEEELDDYEDEDDDELA